MKGLLYQLKSVWKDKFCIMSFLLPVVVALALNFVGSIGLFSLGEFMFMGCTFNAMNIISEKEDGVALIVLSAFVSALIGLFVGRSSDGLMVGVVYIKIVMIVFMAVPILYYLAGTGSKILAYICYLIPSRATLEGIMDLANGGTGIIGKDIAILAIHCVDWFLLYLLMSKRQKKHA